MLSVIFAEDPGAGRSRGRVIDVTAVPSEDDARGLPGEHRRVRILLLICVNLAVIVGALGQVVLPARGSPFLAWLCTAVIPGVVALLLLLSRRDRRGLLVLLCLVLNVEALLSASLFVIGLAFAILLPIIGIALVQPYVRGRTSLAVYAAAGVVSTISLTIVELEIPPNTLADDQPVLTIVAFALVAAAALGLLWRAGEGQIHALDAADREIDARISAERRATATADRLQTLITSSPVATIAVDRAGAVTVWNPAAERLFGWKTDEVLGQYLPSSLEPGPDEEQAGIREFVGRTMAGEPISGEHVHAHDRAGRELILEIHADAGHGRAEHELGVIIHVIDITERTALEAQLVQAQRMEAVGQLAGGIAHDINNAMTAIGGFAELIETATEDEAIQTDARTISDAVKRARQLTTQLLAFARRSILQPEVIEVTTFIASIQPIFRRLVGSDIEIRMRHEVPKAAIRVDPGQFEQALINLVVNARDAMPGGGTLTIGTSRRDVMGHHTAPDASDTGGRIVVSVTDTGTGIDRSLQAQVFEPFFTTKKRGAGSGLGLAMVYGFVAQSGGEVELQSTPNAGTTVEITLPEVFDAPVQGPVGTGRAVRGGNEAILVIEDEPAVGEFVRRILMRLGYEVIGAFDGKSAIALARAHRKPIHLILSDVMMPGMSGPEAVEAILPIHPESMVLFASGYSADAITDRGVLPARVELIEKPYTRRELALRVRAILDGAATVR
jgi:two-component system cell cycle sensor histidine kinase/response regulator CckA